MKEEGGERLVRLSSGVAGLDVILSGGFLAGGLYIIQGPPGTGKTTFGNQICFNHVAGGRQALYVTLPRRISRSHDAALEHHVIL